MTAHRARVACYAAWRQPVLLLLLSGIAMGWLSLHPHSGPGLPVAAIFPPWWRADRIAAAAASGGALVREGVAANILVVVSAEDGLPYRLRRAGAWLVVDPAALGGCLGGRS